jgi:enterochelin esterase-like enzyme
MNIIQAVGKSAFDAGMNAAFHQALNDAGIAHRYLEFDGGHEWSVVAEAMPHLVDFARQAVRGNASPE